MSEVSVLLKGLLPLVLLWLHRRKLRRFFKALREEWKARRPRRWTPQTALDCAQCQTRLRLKVMRARADIQPYSERRSCRGRKKTVATGGYARPHLSFDYRGVTDSAVHALVGYRTHKEFQRFRCLACGKGFTCLDNTPLHYPMTDPKEVKAGAVVSGGRGGMCRVLVCFPSHSDVTVARWVERMARHSQGWHNALFAIWC